MDPEKREAGAKVKRLMVALMLVAGTGWGATLSLVPTGQPGDYTVFDTAYAAMLATDTLQVGITVTGPVTLANGTFTNHPVYPGGFTSNETSEGSGTIYCPSGGVTVCNLFINNTSGTTGRCLFIDTSGVTNFENNEIYSCAQNTMVDISGSCWFKKNQLKWEPVIEPTGFMFFSSETSALNVCNNIFIGPKDKYYPSTEFYTQAVYFSSDSGGVTFNQNTIYNFYSGIYFESPISAKNNVIANCEIGVEAGESHWLSYISYSANEGDIVGWGQGCVSITTANSFVNPSPSQLQDFIPLHNSLIARTGIPIDGVTTDILGNPYANPPSMGAIQAPASGWDWLDRYYWNSEAIR